MNNYSEEFIKLDTFFKTNKTLYYKKYNHVLLIYSRKDQNFNHFNYYINKEKICIDENIKTINEPLDIENFNNIEFINCEHCNIDEIINLEKFKNLKNLNCSYNNLVNLNVNNLKYLDCSYNKITQLHIDQIRNVNCKNNYIEKIYFTDNSNCSTLNCSNNNISSLNINKSLKTLYCFNNILTFLDLKNLISVDCSYNLIEKVVFNKNLIMNQFFSLYNKFKNIYIPYKINNIKLYNEGLQNIFLNENDFMYYQSLNKLFLNKKKLKKIKINAFIKKIENYDTKDICCICLENLIKDVYETECKHKFHYECFIKILNFTCPYCRKSFLYNI